MTGKKFDVDKPRWCLLPPHPLRTIVRVLTMGAEKYGDNNWKYVKHAKDRYYSAALRHLMAWKDGEKKDKESKLSHLAHVGCCIIFLMWFDGDK